MATIAIDFGMARTKVATYDAEQHKAILIELGREVRSIIPSLVYIPAEGPALVGDDAQEEILCDPAGAVRGLKKEIHKQDFILRSGRKMTPGDLLTALFARIKVDCKQFHFQGEEVYDCCLTVPVKFDQHQRDCISEAASRAGFKNITVLEEPVAAAMHWLSQNGQDIRCIAICDIGAGTTDIALLRRDGNQLRQIPDIQPSGFNRGGDDIDDAIWDSLQSQALDPVEHADMAMLQLRKLKERFTRRTIEEDRLKLGKTSIPVTRSAVEKCFSQFIQQVLAELRRLAEQMKKAGIESAPLVLAGGGANIPGLEAAIRNDNWPGEVFRWSESEYASALGAATFLAKASDSATPKSAAIKSTAIKVNLKDELLVASDGSGDYRTITEAMLAAKDGALIRVRPGLYHEGLVIDRLVRIVGDGPAERIIIENDLGPALTATAIGATVKGLGLRCASGRNSLKFPGVDVSSGNLRLEDCDIFSDSGNGAIVHGNSTNPAFRNCRVRHQGSGYPNNAAIYVQDYATGTFEVCDLSGPGVGIRVETVGNPYVRGCKIHDCDDDGVDVSEEGKGTFEDCDISTSGVSLSEKGNPVFRRCKIYKCEYRCIEITEGSRGLFEECEVFAGDSGGIKVSESDPLFRRCSIHDCEGDGIRVTKSGGTFDECEIFNNKGGIAISGSNTVFRKCEIHHCCEDKYSGMGIVILEGAGIFEDCDVFKNGLIGFWISDGGDPVVKRCKIHGHELYGVQVNDEGRGTFEGCTSWDNKAGNFKIDADCVVKRVGNKKR